MKLSLVLFISAISFANSAKILAIFPEPTKSHYAIGDATARALHDAGHEVMIISAFEQKVKINNYRQIKLDSVDEAFNGFEVAELSPYETFSYLYSWGQQNVENVMKNEKVKALMKSNQKFDVVIVELFAMDALLGFGQHFGCPVIGVTSFDAVYFNDFYTGNESPYSYVPMDFTGFSSRMNFGQRIYNTVYSMIEKVTYNFHHLPIQKALYEKYFPKATQTFEEALKSVSIVFMNNHVSSATARPFLPNMIGINGIHILAAKPLHPVLKTFLDTAADGVILFSMGSTANSTDWPLAQREAIVNTFAKLKQRVIWKYENETLPGKSDTVLISPWIPQRDILAHPKVKLFITHGGNLGTTEALGEGVPILGIPLFGDQMLNIRRAVEKGYALSMDFRTLNEQNFEETIKELLDNPKYKENAERMSAIFKDRPLSPRQSVVYWTEFVINHKGAHHLKSAGQKLNYLEYNLIDVYLTLAVITAVLFYIFYKIFKCILRKVCCKSPAKKTQKQKKN